MDSGLTSESSAVNKDDLGGMKKRLTSKRSTVLASFQRVLYLASQSSSVFKAEHSCVVNTLVCLFKTNSWLVSGGQKVCMCRPGAKFSGFPTLHEVERRTGTESQQAGMEGCNQGSEELWLVLWCRTVEVEGRWTGEQKVSLGGHS